MTLMPRNQMNINIQKYFCWNYKVTNKNQLGLKLSFPSISWKEIAQDNLTFVTFGTTNCRRKKWMSSDDNTNLSKVHQISQIYMC